MERLANPFSALSCVEDDDDVIGTVNTMGQNSPKTSQDDSCQGNQSQRNGGDAQPLYKPLVWIDLEMTGLDIKRDRILEIACIITDGKLEKVIEGPDLIIKQPGSALAGMNAWCQEHHTASGLVEGVRRSTITEQEAEEQVLDFVNQYVPGKAHIAGNSVYVDLQFIQKYMPKLARVFSHIVVDVSSIRALCKRWYPQDANKAPEKKNHHRARDDIKESIAELRNSRSNACCPSQRTKAMTCSLYSSIARGGVSKCRRTYSSSPIYARAAVLCAAFGSPTTGAAEQKSGLPYESGRFWMTATETRRSTPLLLHLKSQ